MTLFFLLAALLVVAALAALLAGPLLARRQGGDDELRAANVALARERRAELAAARASGAIDAATHALELERLERALADDLAAEGPARRRDGTLSATLLVALFVPIAAGSLYLGLGEPAAIDRAGEAVAVADAAGRGAGDGLPPVTELLPRLEQRLAESPGDVDGWRLLGRSYLAVERFDEAARALGRAVALDGDDVATLGQLAEALAMGAGGALAGEPVALLERVLERDPDDPQGLWLRAIAHQQAAEHTDALALFGRLRAVMAGDAEAIAAIDAMAARSRAASGSAPSAADGTRPSAPADAGGAGAAPAASATAETGEARVRLRVALSEAARADVEPGHGVFVYARASEGPPTPLAVARYTVADLPVEVTLDEGMAMMPSASLAGSDTVTVGARVAKTGDARGAPGDWYAERDGVAVGAESVVELVIDARQL